MRTTGGERYARNGSFTLDGEAVLTANGTLQVPERDGPVSIGADGTISMAKGPIGRLRLVRFDDRKKLSAEGATLFALELPSTEVPATQIRLATGALENSNVNAAREMSSLIAAARAYDQVANTILREDDKNELRKLAVQLEAWNSALDQPRIASRSQQVSADCYNVAGRLRCSPRGSYRIGISSRCFLCRHARPWLELGASPRFAES